MMNRIRTAIERKRAAEQTQSYYAWRPGPAASDLWSTRGMTPAS